MAILLALSLLILAFVIYTNIYRLGLKYKYELVPNCLMTRYPLVFISGKKTLFYFLNFWNFIPYYLRDHGYEVIELKLPWHNSEARIATLNHFLRHAEAYNLTYHFIAEQTSETECQWLAEQSSSSIKSCHIFTSSNKIEETHSTLKPSNYNYVVHHFPSLERSFKGQHPLWRLLIFCHNLSLYPDQSLNPTMVAIPSKQHVNFIAQYYLNFAISLAENDMKC